MNTVIDGLNHAAATWWPHVFHGAWQALVLGVVLLAIVWFGRRWPSPLRYGLLMIGLLKFATPPMLDVPT